MELEGRERVEVAVGEAAAVVVVVGVAVMASVNGAARDRLRVNMR